MHDFYSILLLWVDLVLVVEIEGTLPKHCKKKSPEGLGSTSRALQMVF